MISYILCVQTAIIIQPIQYHYPIFKSLIVIIMMKTALFIVDVAAAGLHSHVAEEGHMMLQTQKASVESVASVLLFLLSMYYTHPHRIPIIRNRCQTEPGYYGI